MTVLFENLAEYRGVFETLSIAEVFDSGFLVRELFKVIGYGQAELSAVEELYDVFSFLTSFILGQSLTEKVSADLYARRFSVVDIVKRGFVRVQSALGAVASASEAYHSEVDSRLFDLLPVDIAAVGADVNALSYQPFSLLNGG